MWHKPSTPGFDFDERAKLGGLFHYAEMHAADFGIGDDGEDHRFCSFGTSEIG